jgi:hypothetical protein
MAGAGRAAQLATSPSLELVKDDLGEIPEGGMSNCNFNGLSSHLSLKACFHSLVILNKLYEVTVVSVEVEDVGCKLLEDRNT